VKIEPSLFMIGFRNEADGAERLRFLRTIERPIETFVLDKNNQMITSFFPMLSRESIAYAN
jgi:hypothetical protein